jgi:glycerol kinase
MAATTTTAKEGAMDVHVYEPKEVGPFIGSIDQGTSSTRFVLISKRAVLVASAQIEHAQIYDSSKPGYHEHDPTILWHNTVLCMAAVVKAMEETTTTKNGNHSGTTSTSSTPLIAAIGITNQRETTIAWNNVTGRPYYNAIVWDDTRTADIAASISTDLTKLTGLPNSSYFAGTKVRWLLENVESLRNDVKNAPEQVCFGTVDSWLLYQLTGQCPKNSKSGRKLKGTNRINIGGCFKTDVTNASRWLFMNLEHCQWDESCIKAVLGPDLTVPLSCLPEICPSAYPYGTVAECGVHHCLVGIPISSLIGDQQSALFGQAAFQPGSAKNTYGTGLVLMVNTGSTIVPSTHGLLTTVAYQLFDKDAPVRYALEGSVSHGGATIQWLRDALQIISSADESEKLARKTKCNDGCYFVPAFGGLFAPYWRSDARGCLVGLTAAHTKHHVCRAALEAMCYQSHIVFAAIQKDTGIPLTSLRVDGGGSHNELLMQFQADMIQVPVIRPKVMETTALGAAFCAGLTIQFWRDVDEIQALWAVDKTYKPRMPEAERQSNLAGWEKAVSKSLGWVGSGDHGTTVPSANHHAGIVVVDEVKVVNNSCSSGDPSETAVLVAKEDDGPAIVVVEQRQTPRSAIVIDEPPASGTAIESTPLNSNNNNSHSSSTKKHVSFATKEEEIVPVKSGAAWSFENWASVMAAATVSLVMGIVVGRATIRKQ